MKRVCRPRARRRRKSGRAGASLGVAQHGAGVGQGGAYGIAGMGMRGATARHEGRSAAPPGCGGGALLAPPVFQPRPQAGGTCSGALTRSGWKPSALRLGTSVFALRPNPEIGARRRVCNARSNSVPSRCGNMPTTRAMTLFVQTAFDTFDIASVGATCCCSTEVSCTSSSGSGAAPGPLLPSPFPPLGAPP